MKTRSEYDVKSSLQSWLIALICCIVVIGAIVCGVVFGIAPMQVAKAAVDTWDNTGSTLYTAHVESLSFVSTSNRPTGDITCTGSLTYSKNNSVTIRQYTLIKRLWSSGNNGGGTYSIAFYGGNNNGTLYCRFAWSLTIVNNEFVSSYLGAYTSNTYTTSEYLCDYMYFNLTSSIVPTTLSNAYTSQWFDVFVYNHTPEFDFINPITLDVYYTPLDFNNTNANHRYVLNGLVVTNADDHLDAGGECYVDVIYTLIDNSTVTAESVKLTHIDNTYILVLSCPITVSYIDVNFVGYNDLGRIGSSSSVNLFKDNYLALNGVKIYGVQVGKQLGYDEGYTDQNNLMSVIWNTFELPFNLMFGNYDSDVQSDTYGEYVGGLFNFTILGLDVRAFILGVMSLLILISIFKFITGIWGLK